MPDIPILARKAPALAAGQKFLVELTMISGARHRLKIDFPVPTGADGLPDLKALKDFDPAKNTHAHLTQLMAVAHADPFMMQANNVAQQIVIKAEGGAVLALRYVESFRFLGTVDEVAAADAGLDVSQLLKAARS